MCRARAILGDSHREGSFYVQDAPISPKNTFFQFFPLPTGMVLGAGNLKETYFFWLYKGKRGGEDLGRGSLRKTFFPNFFFDASGGGLGKP